MQWDKDGAEAAGLVKIDLLGNRSLGVIRDTVLNIRRNGRRLDESRWEPEEDWASPRAIVEMIRQVTAGGGNLLLDFGPKPDGSLPENVEERLLQVGKWLKGNEEAVYGKFDRVERKHFHPWLKYGKWTRKGNVGYFWCRHWRGRELVIVDQKTKVKRITFLKTGKPVKFTQEPGKLVLKGLPQRAPDRIAHTTIFKIEFEREPRRMSDHGYPLVWCGQ